jgi:flagellin-like hook-associated protein FlgL
MKRMSAAISLGSGAITHVWQASACLGTVQKELDAVLWLQQVSCTFTQAFDM